MTELLFTDFFEANPQPGIVFNASIRKILLANEAFCTLSGYTREEITSRRIDSFIQGFDTDLKSGSFEGWLITKQTLPIKITSQIIKVNAHSEWVIFIQQSTATSDKNATQSLKDNLLLLSNHIDDVIWTLDMKGYITFVSQQITDLIGYLPGEMLHLHLSQILTPESYKRAMQVLSEEMMRLQKMNLQQTAIPLTRIELEQVKKDGHTIWTEVLVSSIWDNTGNVIELMGVTKNIHRQKETENQLIESQRSFKQFWELTPEASVMINKLGIVVSANKALSEVTGFPLDDLIGKHFTQLPFFELKQIPEYIKIFASLVKGEDLKPYKYTWKDAHGNKHIGIAHLALVKKGNQIEGLQSITTDITQQANAENALIESEEKFRTIFLNSPLGVFYFDNKGVLTDCNFQFETIIGAPRNKLIGLDLLNQLVDANMVKAINETLIKGQSEFEGIYTTATSNRQIPVRVLIKALRNKKEQIIGAIGIVEDISERIDNQNAMKANEAKFRNLFENSPLGLIYYNKHGYVLDCNHKIMDIVGDVKEKIVGRNLFEYIKHDGIINEIKKSLTEGSGYYVSKSQTRLFDKYPHIRGFFKGIPDDQDQYTHGLAIIEDLTERYKTEQELQEKSQKLIIAIQSAGFGIWEWNVIDNIYTVSPEFLSLISIDTSINGATLEKWMELIYPDDINEILAQYKKCIENKGDEFIAEFRVNDQHGQVKWLLSKGRITEYDESNQPIKIVGVHSDITKLRRTELELLEKNEEIALQNEEYVAINEELQESFQRIQNINQELITAKNKAEENDKLKTAFLQNMSHEIRTPMNGILGFAQLLEFDHSSAEKRKEYIKIINESCQQLLNIVNDILDISRIETGQMTVHLKQTDIYNMMESLLQFHKPQANIHHLQLFLNTPEKQPLVINTDPDKLRQILNNLLSNAIKYTSAGSVHFGCKPINGFIEFYVRDTGIGIKPENFQSIFERFIQTHNTATKRYSGTGLGLPISKGLVNILGGKIWLESEQGVGSTFYFTIPSGQHDNKMQKSVSHDYLSSLPTLLVAEDQESNFFLIKEMLQNSEYNIIRAGDGIEAVEKFKQNPAISLILMDIKMPNMDGYEASRLIRQINADIPIIAQTAYAMLEDREKVIEAGCNDYISKPFNKQTLNAIINKYLNKAK